MVSHRSLLMNLKHRVVRFVDTVYLAQIARHSSPILKETQNGELMRLASLCFEWLLFLSAVWCGILARAFPGWYDLITPDWLQRRFILCSTICHQNPRHVPFHGFLGVTHCRSARVAPRHLPWSVGWNYAISPHAESGDSASQDWFTCW